LVAGGAIAVAAAGGVLLAARAGRDNVGDSGSAVRGTADGRGAPGVVEPVRHLEFSWLPEGYRWRGFITDSLHELISGGDPSDGDSFVAAAMYAAGVTPPSDERDDVGSAWVEATGAERVNDRPTRWMGLGSGRTSARVRMQWQRTAQAWATLELAARPGQDNFASARRIATGVRFDLVERVKVPLRLKNLPAAMRLQALDAYGPDSADEWAFSLTFADTPRPLQSNAAYSFLEVRVNPMSAVERRLMDDPLLGPDTAVDGRPARRERREQPGADYQDRLTVWDLDGLKVTVNIAGGKAHELMRSADVLAIFHQLELFPAKADWI
jgi:hypothetical protein